MKWRCVAAAMVAALAGIASVRAADSPRQFFERQIGEWKLTGGPKPFDKVSIYDYMDGAADPYMNFTYGQLFVAQYEKGEKRLVVELYDMGSPVEAYGAFTLDVEGKPANVGTEAIMSESGLRVWKGRYFIKIFDFSASGEPGEGAVEIAKAIASKIAEAGERPGLFTMIPAELKPSLLRYYHKDATLGEIHYISTKNVLGLSEKTDGVWAQCEALAGKPGVTVIRYPNADARDDAWEDFCGAVFMQPIAGKGPEPIYAEQLERGACTGIRKWSGPAGEPLLGICFEAKTVDQCTKTLQALGGEGTGKGGK